MVGSVGRLWVQSDVGVRMVWVWLNKALWERSVTDLVKGNVVYRPLHDHLGLLVESSTNISLVVDWHRHGLVEWGAWHILFLDHSSTQEYLVPIHDHSHGTHLAHLHLERNLDGNLHLYWHLHGHLQLLHGHHIYTIETRQLRYISNLKKIWEYLAGLQQKTSLSIVVVWRSTNTSFLQTRSTQAEVYSHWWCLLLWLKDCLVAQSWTSCACHLCLIRSPDWDSAQSFSFLSFLKSISMIRNSYMRMLYVRHFILSPTAFWVAHYWVPQECDIEGPF